MIILYLIVFYFTINLYFCREILKSLLFCFQVYNTPNFITILFFCIVKNKRNRMQIIVELIQNECIGSQSELAMKLAERNVNVTQATLSRDLKALKISKVATDRGGYMYIIPDGREVQNKLRQHGMDMPLHGNVGFQSVEFSGNFAVIKTRNGYATGLAYDIDMARLPEILGTIAGADTVFAILREGASHEQVREFLARFAQP